MRSGFLFIYFIYDELKTADIKMSPMAAYFLRRYVKLIDVTLSTVIIIIIIIDVWLVFFFFCVNEIQKSNS